MKKIAFVFSCIVFPLYAQNKIEYLPFGDMNSWIVRYIEESALIGGQTKALYAIGKADTIYSNHPYPYGQDGSPWGTSNAFAKVCGVRKVAVSAFPEKRDNGYCCKLQTSLQTVTAVGINIKAVATGSLFTGQLGDPITLEGAKCPAKAIDMGIPFAKRPSALILDYKAIILPAYELQEANASTKVKTLLGHDEGEILLFLQHRWEDEDGNIFAYRVGTASEHITQTIHDWQNDHRLPIRYGDLSLSIDFKLWEALTCTRFMARNSKGKMVYIQEIDYRGDIVPTHLIIQISSGCQRPFVGCPGNTLWCDNIRLEYSTNKSI